MARYKHYSYDQSKLIPVRYRDQILPGTFEFALSNIVDRMDMSVFAQRFKNDDGGAPAYDPSILLKIVLFAYSRGIVSSRQIARACRENVVFMALSADSHPHFTTIADFVSSLGDEIAPLFANVLAICAEEGLIGRNMFAIDGCKISSNCSKEWSGTREDFERKKGKLEKSVKLLLRKHRQADRSDDDDPEGRGGSGPDMRRREEEAIRKLQAKIDKIDRWMSGNEDKVNRKGKVKKSNMTDNESAKMVSSHGVIQGYNGIAAADSKHQVIVHAEAFGEGHEGQLMKPVLEGIRETLSAIGEKADEVMKEAVFLMDSGYSSDENIEAVFTEGIDALIADNKYR
ncbi:MAG: transposase, partial [Nitrospirota bacterium]|nr:transposase [Nitrospirota bacterium]